MKKILIITAIIAVSLVAVRFCTTKISESNRAKTIAATSIPTVKLDASRDSFMLEAWPGMEEIFAERREKCRLLQEMIQALESEPVRRSMAEWQQEIMKQGGPGKNIGL